MTSKNAPRVWLTGGDVIALPDTGHVRIVTATLAGLLGHTWHAVAPDAATLVFVEHDMEIVSRYADRVVAFYQGRILADGAPSDVLKDQEVRRYVTGGVR